MIQEQCHGRADHTAHKWNVYDPEGNKLSRVNPDGDRLCPGYRPPWLDAVAGLLVQERMADCS